MSVSHSALSVRFFISIFLLSPSVIPFFSFPLGCVIVPYPTLSVEGEGERRGREIVSRT